jgi:hypothetical protein
MPTSELIRRLLSAGKVAEAAPQLAQMAGTGRRDR